MTFTVIWQPPAIQELANLWTTAVDRNAVAHAADAIDAILKRDPLSVGESRSEDYRIYFEPPLVVHYRVLQDDCLVRVLKVLSI